MPNLITNFTTSIDYTSGSGVFVNSGSNGLAILSGSGASGPTNDYSAFFPTGGSTINTISMGTTVYDDPGDRTFMWWMKVTTFPPPTTYGGIFGKWSGVGSNEGYLCRYRNIGEFWFFTWTAGSGNVILITDISSHIASGEWHHFTVLHEAGVSQSLYIDGNLIDGLAFPAGESVKVNTAQFQIGNDDGSEAGMAGNLDDFAVFNTALSASVITEYSESGVPTNALDLVALYKFEEGTGVTASNSADSPEGTGTINNNATFSIDVPYSSSGGGITYPTESIFVYKTAGDGFDAGLLGITLSSFSASYGPNNAGIVKYQLSTDALTWNYWNTSAWVSASDSQRTTEADANTNIADFNVSANDTLYVQSFLESDGSQAVELDTITIGYTAVTGSESGDYLINLIVSHLN